MEQNELIKAWRAALDDPGKSWAVFEHGTCVVLIEPGADPAAQAVALLREFGPVGPGSSFGDFGVIALPDGRGWVVTSHHNDVLTFVGPDEFDSEAEEVAIGLFGRSKRGQDADELRIVHVEEARRP